MPDWSYHPLLRPVGIALHGERTREITLRRLHAFGRSSVGRWLIRFMGHQSPPASIGVQWGNVRFPSPVILGSSIDPTGIGFDAFSQMEFGGIEIEGDVSHPERNGVVVIERAVAGQPCTGSVIRVSPELLDDIGRDTDVVLVEVDASMNIETLQSFVARGATGFVVESAVFSERIPAFVQDVRVAFGTDVLIAAGGYVATPGEAVALRQAGADLIVVGEGLAIAGPGLPKRINEAIVAMLSSPVSSSLRIEPSGRNWISGTLFGIGIVFASFIATYLALTSVILGYDEHFAHTSIDQLHAINPHLVDFMSHDRLSYAGATLSLGVFYTALAFFGIRKGHTWAFHAFVVSGIAGFSTFLLFIAYGYFDVGNALVALVVLPFFLAAVARPPNLSPVGLRPDLTNDRKWRRSLVGQLLFVVLAMGLIIGGTVICVVGSTNVFVISDLDFLGTTSHHIETANERLLPLIAHDRVSFGGAIVCNGLATLLISLWGFRRGEFWVWWSLLIGGTLNLAFVFYAHLTTGYTEVGHLLPVAIGAAFFGAGLILSHNYLCDKVR